MLAVDGGDINPGDEIGDELSIMPVDEPVAEVITCGSKEIRVSKCILLLLFPVPVNGSKPSDINSSESIIFSVKTQPLRKRPVMSSIQLITVIIKTE